MTCSASCQPALRRAGSGSRRGRGNRFTERSLVAANAVPRLTGWPRVLLWLPLWRGPARRAGHGLWLGGAVLCLPGLGLMLWSSAAGWWLAGFAALALVAVTRVNALMRDGLAPVLEACKVLPLSQARLRRARSLPLLLLLPGSAMLLVGLASTGLRPGMLAAYFAVCVVSCGVKVFSSPADAAAKTSRWLFSLVLGVALATQVMA